MVIWILKKVNFKEQKSFELKKRKIICFLVALEKIRVEFIQRSQSSDEEEGNDEESHHEDNDSRLGARKKRLISGPKRLVATIYTENSSSPIEALENGGI